jgi:hypothetical protein
MQLMNSEKSLGVSENKTVEYDESEFLQKMFSNGDNEIKNIEPTPKPKISDLLSKKMGAHQDDTLIKNDSDPL